MRKGPAHSSKMEANSEIVWELILTLRDTLFAETQVQAKTASKTAVDKSLFHKQLFSRKQLFFRLSSLAS